MVEIEVRVTGLDAAVQALDGLPEAIDAGVMEAIRQTDLSILERVKLSFPNGVTGTPRPAGMAGPPRRLTGNLSRSTVEIPVGGVPGARTGGVGVLGTAPYGEQLETGGLISVPAHVRTLLKGKARSVEVRAYDYEQPAYPYLQPAVAEEEPLIEATFQRYIQDQIESLGRTA